MKALLQNGGRLIDTAYMYGNEDAVGEGVRQAMENSVIQIWMYPVSAWAVWDLAMNLKVSTAGR